MYKYVTDFRQNISKDYPIWNQHRYIETFGEGDVINVTVNIKENWCQFSKNGILHYHVDHLPVDPCRNLDNEKRRDYGCLYADLRDCFVIDRKV